MKLPLWRREAILAVVLSLYCLLCSGCGAVSDKPADQELSLVLAGMDGTDGVSFEGAATLLLGGKPVEQTALYYGGKVADHNKVSLYTLLPDENGETKAAAKAGLKKLEQRQTPEAYYTQLEKKDGEWTMLTGAPAANAGNPLPALNPLLQLEELEGNEKKVTKRAGAARGTKELRVELTPGEARKQLSAELEREMLLIRPSGDSKPQEASGKPKKVNETMLALWEQKDEELRQRLEQAEISSVYYLKVDVKRNLPKRLTWTRKVKYPSAAGSDAEETYITKVDFYGFR